MQRDVRYPGRVAVRILLGNDPSDVDPVRELDAQLERPESEVHAQDVVRGPVRPGFLERRVQLRPSPPGIVLHGAVGIDHSAEIEADHAGEPAEEREPDQHVERELELRLSDVVAVAEQPRVTPAEAAQVVEAREVEPPPEPAALRRPGGEAEIEPASADHAEGVDRIGLQVRVQAIVTASGNVAAAELYQQRCATDRATHAVARGIPTI